MYKGGTYNKSVVDKSPGSWSLQHVCTGSSESSGSARFSGRFARRKPEASRADSAERPASPALFPWLMHLCRHEMRTTVRLPAVNNCSSSYYHIPHYAIRNFRRGAPENCSSRGRSRPHLRCGCGAWHHQRGPKHAWHAYCCISGRCDGRTKKLPTRNVKKTQNIQFTSGRDGRTPLSSLLVWTHFSKWEVYKVTASADPREEPVKVTLYDCSWVLRVQLVLHKRALLMSLHSHAWRYCAQEITWHSARSLML